MARFSFLVSALVAVALAGTVLAAAILVGLVPTGPAGVSNGSPGPTGLHSPGPSLTTAVPTVAVPSASASPLPSVQLSPGGTYVVQTGDSLFLIGVKYGVPWQLIAQANNIAGPDYVIQVGDVL